MIYAGPGATFEAVLENEASGLVGTLGVRIMDGQGATTTARTTSGIVETPASSGTYVATLTAPTTAGQYVVFWDTGTVSPSTTASEDLTVTHTAPVASSPSGYDLTTLGAVRTFLEKAGAETGEDDLIQQLITRASKTIMTWTQREFAPATASAARSFAYSGGGLLSLAPYDLRSVTTIQFDTDTSSPTTLATTDYALRPLNTAYGTYDLLRVPNFTVADQPDKIGAERVVTITGAWGFASVPADVEQAAIITVADWLRADASAFTRSFNVEAGQFEYPRGIPDKARAILSPYRRIPVA